MKSVKMNTTFQCFWSLGYFSWVCLFVVLFGAWREGSEVLRWPQGGSMRADAAHTEVSSLVTLAGGKAAQGLETWDTARKGTAKSQSTRNKGIPLFVSESPLGWRRSWTVSLRREDAWARILNVYRWDTFPGSTLDGRAAEQHIKNGEWYSKSRSEPS